MRFGLGPLTIDQSYTDKKLTDIYEEALEHSAVAEWWGLDSVWADERYFTSSNANSSSTVLGAALAQRTRFVRVGMVTTLGLVNPLYVAEEVACIDNIGTGRSIVTARVPTAGECRAWNVERSIDRVADDIAILRKAWGANPFNHSSAFHKIPMENPIHVEARGLDRISVQPKPAQLELPLWLTGDVEAARLADELGVPFVGPAGYSLAELRPMYQSRRRRTLVTPLIREVFIAETDEQAYELAAEPVSALYRSYTESSAAGRFEDLVADRFVMGSPETCIRQLYRYQEELGVDYVIARLCYHSMHHAETVAAIQLFGQGVVPEFRMFGLPEEIRTLSRH